MRAGRGPDKNKHPVARFAEKKDMGSFSHLAPKSSGNTWLCLEKPGRTKVGQLLFGLGPNKTGSLTPNKPTSRFESPGQGKAGPLRGTAALGLPGGHRVEHRLLRTWGISGHPNFPQRLFHQLAVSHPVALVNIKIGGTWVFIRPKWRHRL